MTLEQMTNAIAVPLQAVTSRASETSVLRRGLRTIRSRIATVGWAFRPRPTQKFCPACEEGELVVVSDRSGS